MYDNKKKCIVEKCSDLAICKGYCNTHYACWKRTGDPIAKTKPHRNKICSAKECDSPHRRNGYCAKHSKQLWSRGEIDPIHGNVKYETDEERKQAIKKAQKIYSQSPKGRMAYRLKRQRRRALEAQQTSVLTQKEALDLLEKSNYNCLNCGSKDHLHLDHYIPLCKGGKLKVGNVIILCRICNGAKSGKDPQEFFSEETLKKAQEFIK